jgi:UDP-glucose 4-epimerase|tara:strand:- start:12154 stop:13173 length:1020 start_codon:yes stop_codon:yes gene_type:complete
MNILVTGGAGFIGSHTCVELLDQGHHVVVVDNLSNSKEAALRRVEKICAKSVQFYRTDLMDKEGLDRVLSDSSFDSVIHFAGLKAPGESVSQPLAYYQNNVTGTLNLCEAMSRHGVKNLVFSSSATVYGDADTVPLHESLPVSSANPINPYGRSKVMVEEILQDQHSADPEWNIALLRYFNPVGAHPSGLLGEDPNGIPINLMPYITQVVIGKLDKLTVFGDDYPTPDGTPLRDYIHVMDLAKGHLAAIDRLASNPGVVIYNLGAGRGVSVFELVKAFEKVNGVTIPLQVGGRRSGDLPTSYTDTSLAKKELHWQAELSIEDICRDAWRWQQQNPQGFD